MSSSLASDLTARDSQFSSLLQQLSEAVAQISKLQEEAHVRDVQYRNKAGEVAACNKACGVTAGRKAVEVVAGHQAEDVAAGQYKKRDRTNELTRSQYDIDLTKTGHIDIDNLISP